MEIFKPEVVKICKEYLKTVDWKTETQSVEISPIIDLNFYIKDSHKIGILICKAYHKKWTLIHREHV